MKLLLSKRRKEYNYARPTIRHHCVEEIPWTWSIRAKHLDKGLNPGSTATALLTHELLNNISRQVRRLNSRLL